VIEWEAATGNVVSKRALSDVCGVAPQLAGRGFIVSDGHGRLRDERGVMRDHAGTAWDNHLRKV
jgi:hypothetical protein